METPLLETVSTELLASCPSRVSRLQSVWCSGQHLETMPRSGWAHSQQSSRQEPPRKPSPHQHTHRHTGRGQSLALANLSALPHLHVTPAQAKTITAGPWDPDELCDCIATHRLLW